MKKRDAGWAWGAAQKPVNIKRYQVIILAICVLVIMGIAGNMDVQEEERQRAEYCEMVKLWKQTDGQAGWPAYNGEGTCPKESSDD